MNKVDIIAVTGHRPHKLNNEYDGIGKISDHLRKELYSVIEQYQPGVAITGMALGVDMLWAEVALAANLEVWAAIPCKGHTAKWPARSVDRWRHILSHKHTTVMYNPQFDYGPEVMQVRNMWMVERCDLLVAVFDGSRGGTRNCVDYAKSVGRKIQFISPKLATVNG